MPDAAQQRQLVFSAAPSPGSAPKEKRARLALALDDRAWLELLADEWWPLARATPRVRLGVGAPCGEAGADRRVRVIAWIDPMRLPSIEVSRWRAHSWVRSLGTDALDLDEEIA